METKSDIKKAGRPSKEGVFGVCRRVNEEELKEVDSLLRSLRGRRETEPVAISVSGAPLSVLGSTTIKAIAYKSQSNEIDLLKKKIKELESKLEVYEGYSQ